MCTTPWWLGVAALVLSAPGISKGRSLCATPIIYTFNLALESINFL